MRAAIEGKLLENNTSTSFISDDYSGTSEQGTIGLSFVKRLSLSQRVPYQRFHCSKLMKSILS